jgi:Trk K+ transport system NAD-binding subunit
VSRRDRESLHGGNERKRISEVRLPVEAHIVSVIRSERDLLPTPDTVLHTGENA